MSVHWGGKGPGHVSRWPRGVGAMSPYSGATMLLDFLNPVLDPRITFSRGTNATLIDSTGRLTYAPNNLLLRSQEFEDAYWTKFGANFALPPVVTANAGVAPDGTTTADRVQFNCVDNTNAANRSWINPATLSAPAGVRYTGSVWVKAFDTANVGRTIRLAVDNLTSNVFTITADWQRISINGLAVGVIGNFLVETRGTFTTQTADVLLWGAQLEQVTYQTTPSTYNATTASAYYGPRFDYDPVTLAPRGLLIEEARTNLLTYSQDWTNATWSKTNITVTAAATASPDGTVNAQRLQATATAATNVSTAAIAATATSASFSVYVKQGSSATTANSFALRNNTTATNLVLGTLNYATGVWTYSTGSTGVTVSNAGNGWWRLQISASAGITAGDLLIAYTGFLGASATAGDHLFAYGAQLEAGSFATSYIPTVASTVTRNADVATMTGTNFSSWYNQSEGTFVSDWDAIGHSGSNMILAASDSGTTNLTMQFLVSATTPRFLVRTSGVDQVLLDGTSGATTVNKMASAYKVNDFASTVNGATAVTDATGTLPVVDRLGIGSRLASLVWNGHVRTIAYFNTRLPNAQLQTLTAPSLATTLSLDFTSGSYNVGF